MCGIGDLVHRWGDILLPAVLMAASLVALFVDFPEPRAGSENQPAVMASRPAENAATAPQPRALGTAEVNPGGVVGTDRSATDPHGEEQTIAQKLTAVPLR